MWQVTARGRRYDLGLGWFRPASQRDADPPFVEHLSGGAGFFNVIRIYPSRGVGVAVMGNATSYHIDAVACLAPDDRLRDPGTRPRRSWPRPARAVSPNRHAQGERGTPLAVAHAAVK